MSVKVANNRFIVSSLKRYGGFYQQLFRGVSDFQELGRKLIGAAETAIAFRQIDTVGEVGLVLSYLPIKEFQQVGHYYQGWCEYRKGEKAQSVFEQVIEKSATYKGKGYISLAGLVSSQGDYHSGIKYYAEAIQHDKSPAIVVPAIRSIAVIKAMDGGHLHALRDLEKIAPLARYAGPKAYYDYLNSLAVELAEVGRIEEARNISNIVLASAYAFAYPKWRETREDIERKGYRSSRSFVTVTQGATQDNIVHLPERQSSPITQDEPGRVLHFDWETMVKKAKNDTPEIPKDMNVADMIIMVMNLMSKEGNATEEKMRKLLDYAIKLFSK